jgi:hypothetical protein
MQMGYKEMIEEARKSGKADEAKMWKSVEQVDELLCIVKEQDKQKYYDFLRSLYGTLYNNHYATKEFADWDVERMESTQKDGTKITGAYWTCEQAVEAVKGMGVTIPQAVTKWDIYVAINAAKHDWGRKFSDEQVLQIGWLFYFDDEDYEGQDKVFRYMGLK